MMWYYFYYYYAGNKSKLPQVVRRGKISKNRDHDRIEAFIADEEKDDIAIFEEINSLKSCCSRCDSSTNCIKKAFTAGPKQQELRFQAVNRISSTVLCMYVCMYVIICIHIYVISARKEKGCRLLLVLDGCRLLFEKLSLPTTKPRVWQLS